VARRSPTARNAAAHDGAAPTTYAQVTAALLEIAGRVREHLETNGEYVGDRFASEARARHERHEAATARQSAPPDRETEASAPTANEGPRSPSSSGGASTSTPEPDPERPIWGRATLEEAKELIEDGIAIMPLPPGPKDRN
jgi:hypothetical protein